MDLFKRLQIPINSPECKDGLLWLLWNVIGGLVPLWGTAILLSLFDKPIVLFDFLKGGEFILYAASFIGGAMYVIRKDIFPSRNLLNILFYILWAICLLVFAAITVTAIGGNPGWLKIGQDTLTSVSIIVLITSITVCFLIAVAEALGVGIDVPDALKSDEKKLNATFDALLKAHGKAKGAGHA